MSGNLFTTKVSEIDVKGKQGPHQALLISAITVIDARAAVRVSDGLEAIQLTASAASLSRIIEWPSCGGFEVNLEPETPGSPLSKMNIFIQLTESRFREVFYSLCDDVCSVLTNETSEADAASKIHSRLIKWQSFLKQHQADGLSPEAQVGLFGELLVLRDLFLPVLEANQVVPAWRGCKKAQQDFQFADRALEVKTSRATILDRVSISSVQQLDEDGMAPLVLSVVHVHANETAGETLPEMVKSLRAVLRDDVLDLLDEGLVEVGYLDEHEKKYEKTRYQLNGVIHHEVKDGFPRLLRKNLPDGVKKVRYEISLDAARDFRIDEKAVHEIFEGVKSASSD